MMHDLYILATGPLLYLSFTLFFGGILVQVVLLFVETYRKERFMFSLLSFKSICASMVHWAMPFGATVMRRQKGLMVVGFAFHIGVLFLPLFVFEHVLLFYEAWGRSWFTVSGWLADGLCLFVIFACLFFLFRRISKPELRYISTPMDYLIPVLVMIPFATGIWANYRLPGYTIIHITHILSGELLLCLIPFTRLSHMALGFFPRVYTSSDFGGTRKAKDW